MHLFAIFIELFLIFIETKLRGIRFHKNNFKVSVFADDV